MALSKNKKTYMRGGAAIGALTLGTRSPRPTVGHVVGSAGIGAGVGWIAGMHKDHIEAQHSARIMPSGGHNNTKVAR